MMTPAEIKLALEARANGYSGGMPLSAKITSAEAVRLWCEGRKAYLPELEMEPLFVELERVSGQRDKTIYKFGATEMKTETFGGYFREIGEELGFRPHASGLNSMRRNAMVGVQKGAEASGRDPSMHAKRVSQHRGVGHRCILGEGCMLSVGREEGLWE